MKQLQARLQLTVPPSSLSDLGGESRVLLADGSVVLQDPLQVGHSFVPVFCLDLRKKTTPEDCGSRWEVLKVRTWGPRSLFTWSSSEQQCLH